LTIETVGWDEVGGTANKKKTLWGNLFVANVEGKPPITYPLQGGGKPKSPAEKGNQLGAQVQVSQDHERRHQQEKPVWSTKKKWKKG